MHLNPTRAAEAPLTRRQAHPFFDGVDWENIRSQKAPIDPKAKVSLEDTPNPNAEEPSDDAAAESVPSEAAPSEAPTPKEGATPPPAAPADSPPIEEPAAQAAPSANAPSPPQEQSEPKNSDDADGGPQPTLF